MQKNYAIRSIFWNKFKSLYLVYSILKNSLESNLDSKGKKRRIYISYVKGLFECVYHSTIERNCIEVTEGLLLKISVYEHGRETPLITSCLSCQRFNRLSSCWTYITSCCKPWYFLFELSCQMLCLFFKAQLQVSINLVIVWFYWLYLMTILST